MKRFLALLLIIPLCGCFSDQQKNVASCQQAAEAFLAESVNASTSAGEPLQVGNLVQECMRIRGYEYSENSKCENDFPVPPPLNVDATMLVINQRKTSALCYVPIGWLDRKVADVEMWFGK
jgi:hypothetical protein